MQSTRPTTIDREAVEELQHINWVNHPHTQLIISKLMLLSQHYDKEAKVASDNYITDTNNLIQLKLRLNQALLTTKIIDYVTKNKWPTSNA